MKMDYFHFQGHRDEPMSIIFDSTKQFEYSIPVIVIGSGGCGLSAALAVKENKTDNKEELVIVICNILKKMKLKYWLLKEIQHH